MANANKELFVNPELIRDLAGKFETLSSKIDETLNSVTTEISNTEATYQAESATQMREKYNANKAQIDKFSAYLKKVATYLKQNVAETAEVVDSVATQNVATIKKPV